MNSKKFILNELTNCVKKFSNVRVRFIYDKSTETNVIEVVPAEFYHFNEEYILWESELFDRFIERYPTQGICFLSDDALVGIENPEYVLYGADYLTASAQQELMHVEQDHYGKFALHNK